MVRTLGDGEVGILRPIMRRLFPRSRCSKCPISDSQVDNLFSTLPYLDRASSSLLSSLDSLSSRILDKSSIDIVDSVFFLGGIMEGNLKQGDECWKG